MHKTDHQRALRVIGLEQINSGSGLESENGKKLWVLMTTPTNNTWVANNSLAWHFAYDEVNLL